MAALFASTKPPSVALAVAAAEAEATVVVAATTLPAAVAVMELVATVSYPLVLEMAHINSNRWRRRWVLG